MTDIKKFILGSVFYEGSERVSDVSDYHDVELDCRDDEAPQIYLSIPMAVTISDVLRIVDTEVCIWVNENAVEKLQEIVDELRSRY